MSDWQPIDTAQKGVQIIVTDGKWVGIATNINGWFGRGDAYVHRVNPTHWMPLPELPEPLQ